MLRFSLLLVALFALSQAEKQFYALEDAEHQFEEFISTYNKQYATEEEKNYRLNIFKENLIKINENNRKYQAEFGITKFSDLSAEEFKQQYTGLVGLGGGCNPAEPPSNVSAPAEFDWRKKGAVTPVKDQGQCGSCWTFSVTGNIEGLYAINKGQQVLLSEQQLIDCDTDGSGCKGGWMDKALAYVAQTGGIMSESDYSYQAVQGSCAFDANRVAARLSGCNSYSGHSEEQMKDILVSVAPLSIGVDASQLQNYRGGIYDCASNGQVDHAVLLVGYGNEGGQQYWTIKNSWGTSWGESGYFRLAFGKNACQVTFTVNSGIIA